MDEVAVLVRMPATYQGREAVVQVPESAFETGCWKTIAALAAAVDLAVPFTDVERVARYGLRPEDRERLGQAAGDGKRNPSTAAAVPLL